MTNRTKIILGIILVLIIILMIFKGRKNIEVNDYKDKKQDEFENVFYYVNNTNNEENKGEL